jgi:AraC-like DNA-binding protein
MTDALSDVLRSVRLRGGVFLDARFTAPWCVDSHLTAEDCKPILERPAHLIGYHFILEGSMRAAVQDGPSLELGAGEIVMIPRNDRHVLSSGPGMLPVNSRGLIRPSPDGGLARISHGGGGSATRIVCGFLGCEDIHHPLLDSLPRMLKIDFREAASRGLIEASLNFAAGELAEGRLASSDMLARLSEILLVEAVRGYAATLDGDQAGWLRGLRDPQVGRALALMHQDIAAPWTAESLAKEVALSRSGFIERFAGLVGMPPIRYLTAWRMATAKLQLRETTRSVAQIAHAVGYDAEESFSRAFKREVGVSPAPWREQGG